MYMSPSNILYTNCVEPEVLHAISIEKNILEASRTFSKHGSYPTLQAVNKGGYYFTLNDTKLRLYRHLEETGQCGLVRIRKVPLREVPEGIRDLMKLPDRPPPKTNTDKPPHLLSRKYRNVGSVSSDNKSQLLEATDDDSDDDDTDDDTDACCNSSDWSYEEPSDTEIVSSDEKKDNDDEEEVNDENESFI